MILGLGMTMHLNTIRTGESEAIKKHLIMLSS